MTVFFAYFKGNIWQFCKENPRPLVCVAAREFSHERFNTSANVPFENYKQGKWEVNNTSPEDLFNFLAPDFFDLIDSVEVGNLTQPKGNNYTKVKFPRNSNFSRLGIDITRKDYYEYLKVYCLNIRWIEE